MITTRVMYSGYKKGNTKTARCRWVQLNLQLGYRSARSTSLCLLSYRFASLPRKLTYDFLVTPSNNSAIDQEIRSD